MSAPKGNQFALGCETSGRPRLWDSPEQLEVSIDDYFEYEDRRPIKIWHTQLDRKTGKPVTILVQRPYTIEGLALFLDTNRQTLLNYEKEKGYEEYFDILTRAKEKIRNSQIQYALVGATKERFTEFLLINNSDYENTSKVDVTSKGKQIGDTKTVVEFHDFTKKKKDE